MDENNILAMLQEGMNLRNELENKKKTPIIAKKKSALKKYFPYGKPNFSNNAFVNSNYNNNSENVYNNNRNNNRRSGLLLATNNINERVYAQNERNELRPEVNMFTRAHIVKSSVHIRPFINRLWSELFPNLMGDVNYSTIDNIVISYEKIRLFKGGNKSFKGMNNKIIIGIIVYYDLLCSRASKAIPIPLFIDILNRVQTTSFKQKISLKDFKKYQEMGKGRIKMIFFTRMCKDKIDPTVKDYLPFLTDHYGFRLREKRLANNIFQRLDVSKLKTNITDGLIAMCIVKAVAKISLQKNIDLYELGFQRSQVNTTYLTILHTLGLLSSSTSRKSPRVNFRNNANPLLLKAKTRPRRPSL